MTDCRFYEIDVVAFSEHLNYMRHCASEGYAGYEPEEEPDRPCYNFCKHYGQHDGFPGETLFCCEHPENRQILDCVSVFDGVDDYYECMRILDEIC